MKPVTNTATVSAPVSHAGLVWSAKVDLEFYTLEDAQAFAAQFPKSWKVKSWTCSSDELQVTQRFGSTDGFTIEPSTISSRWGGRITYGIVALQCKLATDGVNGGRNEAGIKRYRAFTAKLAELGIELKADTSYSNAATLEQVEEVTR